MPVIFVLFKGLLEKSVSWVSKLWSSRSRSSRRGVLDAKSLDPSTGATGSSSRGGNPYREVRGDDRKGLLPQVPRGALTGLRSFVRNVGRSRPLPATQTNVTDRVGDGDDVMLTMMSAEYDYHGHIRNDSGVGESGARGFSSNNKSVGQLPEPTTKSMTSPGRQLQTVQSQGQQSKGHFTEGFNDSVPTNLHHQFVEDHNAHDYLGQLRKTSTIGQAR